MLCPSFGKRARFTSSRPSGLCKLSDLPKAMGDLRGVSYIYPLFYRFGLIDVPEAFAQNMEKAAIDR